MVWEKNKLPTTAKLNIDENSVWLASLCGRCAVLCMLCVFVWFMFDADILYVCSLHIHTRMPVCVCVLVTFANVCIKMVARHRATVCNFSLRFQFAEITIKQVLCIGFIISAFCSHSNRWTRVKRGKTRTTTAVRSTLKRERASEIAIARNFWIGICCMPHFTFSHSWEAKNRFQMIQWMEICRLIYLLSAHNFHSGLKNYCYSASNVFSRLLFDRRSDGQFIVKSMAAAHSRTKP